jgi:cupin fold WbuC family metalloprotein
MIRIEQPFLENLIRQAKKSPRKRQHYNLHKSYDEYLQRFLNAVEPLSYIRPHRHITAGKTEIFIPFTGRFLVLIFNERGDVTDHQVIEPFKSPYAVEISPETYHTVFSLETGSVAFEIKDGPFDPAAAKDFAPWAPEEGTPEASEYLRAIVLQTTGIDL